MKSKKRVFILLILVLIAISLIISSVFIINNNSSKQSPIKFIEKINHESKLYQEYIPEIAIVRETNILKDNNLNNALKYEALINLRNLFETAYLNNANPKTREFVKTIDEYAKENFKKEYNESDFIIICSDPVCGIKTSPEIQAIISEIEKSNIPEDFKKSTIQNLRIASYIPFETPDQKVDKLLGYHSAYINLIVLGDETASASAKKLKEYVKRQLGVDLE